VKLRDPSAVPFTYLTDAKRKRCEGVAADVPRRGGAPGRRGGRLSAASRSTGRWSS